jgi:hypothetical protein
VFSQAGFRASAEAATLGPAYEGPILRGVTHPADFDAAFTFLRHHLAGVRVRAIPVPGPRRSVVGAGIREIEGYYEGAVTQQRRFRSNRNQIQRGMHAGLNHHRLPIHFESARVHPGP